MKRSRIAQEPRTHAEWQEAVRDHDYRPGARDSHPEISTPGDFKA